MTDVQLLSITAQIHEDTEDVEDTRDRIRDDGTARGCPFQGTLCLASGRQITATDQRRKHSSGDSRLPATDGVREEGVVCQPGSCARSSGRSCRRETATQRCCKARGASRNSRGQEK